ncbi:RRXRR domain-containing protein [Limnofasciculus baicalensis]|uniref:RRXRR domain-containing protein n=1 Tax=Limnofasciculus baicalensis BBK-W-15 TaxID=2699891 RepID=A0AAE3GPL2_9CYAN|nr:RRXRR domain-containing protein [Limnofasciculus baicalensis]MCP2727583.1 RRXRR domain-containing protein [Limnofasciculus baicalensis BBK-W-15]
MCKILVIDQDFRPLNPIHPGHARQLLTQKKAAIFRRFPFTVILKESHPDATVKDCENSHQLPQSAKSR